MRPRHERKPLRLPGYDYSLPGAYFVTACTRNRDFLFETAETRLAVESAWHSVLDVFANIELDEFVVMPNHIHGIMWITNEGSYRLHPGTWKNDFDVHCRERQPPFPTKEIKFETLSNIIGAFKTTAATRVNKLRGQLGMAVWQKSFLKLSSRESKTSGRIIRLSSRRTKRFAGESRSAGWESKPPPAIGTRHSHAEHRLSMIGKPPVRFFLTD